MISRLSYKNHDFSVELNHELVTQL